MKKHDRGDRACAACRQSYPVPCECGGLVHASDGCVLDLACDGCIAPRPVYPQKDVDNTTEP